MKSIVVIGYDSYLATGLEKVLGEYKVTNLMFNEWRSHLKTVIEADCVINFSISPMSFETIMPRENILDIEVATELAKNKSKAQFIFLSSRKVYGITNDIVFHNESDMVNPVDFYAKNKVFTENTLKSVIPNNLTILRISNIIGEPVNRSGYKTFIGWICENYLKGIKLQVSQNSNAKKDFITKIFLHECIKGVIEKRLLGIYNISAGFPISVKKILSGYVGEESVSYNSDNSECVDQFVIDNSKIISKLGLRFSEKDLESYLSVCQSALVNMKHKL